MHAERLQITHTRPPRIPPAPGCLEWIQELTLSPNIAEATQSRLCEIMALTCKSLPLNMVEATLSSLLPLIPPPTAACVGTTEQRKAIGAMLAFGSISSHQVNPPP